MSLEHIQPSLMSQWCKTRVHRSAGAAKGNRGAGEQHEGNLALQAVTCHDTLKAYTT